MAAVNPFNALRYTQEAGPAADLVCPPYDIISEPRRQELLDRCEHNCVRLEKPLDYAAAAALLRQWLSNGVLRRDDSPSYYIYEEEFTHNGADLRVSGVIGDLALEPFENGTVLPHEETLPKARGDRRALMEATMCNFSPIYCLYRDEARSVAPLLSAIKSTPPNVEFTDDSGVTHRLWTVADSAALAALTSAFADKTLYIADGHHRYTTALEFAREHNIPGAQGVMSMLVDMDSDGLVVLPTHRLLFNISGFTFDSALERLSTAFDITRVDNIDGLESLLTASKRAVALYAPGKAAVLTLRDESVAAAALPGKSEAYRTLDVAMLHSLILEPVFGIGEAELAAQSHVAYTNSFGDALAKVDGGTAQCAFLLNATGVRQMAAVSLVGEKMPQKSTYFYPKLITGLVMKQL